MYLIWFQKTEVLTITKLKVYTRHHHISNEIRHICLHMTSSTINLLGALYNADSLNQTLNNASAALQLCLKIPKNDC